jgi:hypothetical protein
MTGEWRVRFFALVLAVFTGCAPAMRSTADRPLSPEQIAQLWVEPRDIASRDLFYGAGGSDLRPPDGATFRFEALDTTGFSRGYDVEDDRGREWSVKVGAEAQSEVTASRLLWAVGYHQPSVYYVESWALAGGPTSGPQRPGRFREETDQAEVISEWSWQQNPFVGSRPFKGLVALNLLITNWDLKESNNKVYQLNRAGGGSPKWYVVRDLGASFGKSRWFPYGTRNDVEDFESQEYILGIDQGRVRFDYRGRHRELLADISPADVAWICEWVARLTDRQLDDAFRAGGYGETIRARFVRKLKQKVAQGLALGDERGAPSGLDGGPEPAER